MPARSPLPRLMFSRPPLRRTSRSRSESSRRDRALPVPPANAAFAPCNGQPSGMNKDGGIAGRKIELVIRGRDQPEGHDRALSPSDPAGKSRGRSRTDLDRRQPGRRARGRRGAGAARDVGRHHPGRRQGNDAESALCVSFDRQRMRSGDGIAAGDQVFQGQIQARRRHQSRTIPTAATIGKPSSRFWRAMASRPSSSPSNGRRSERWI